MPPDVNSFVGRGAGRCCSTKASVYDAHFFQGIILYSYEYKAYIHVCTYNAEPRLSPAVVLYIQTVEAGSQRRKVRTAWLSGRSISQLINGRGETPSNKRKDKNKNKNSDIFSLGVCGSKVFTRTSGLGGKDEALGGVGLVSLMRRHMHNCVYYMYGVCMYICRYSTRHTYVVCSRTTVPPPSQHGYYTWYGVSRNVLTSVCFRPSACTCGLCHAAPQRVLVMQETHAAKASWVPCCAEKLADGCGKRGRV